MPPQADNDLSKENERLRKENHLLLGGAGGAEKSAWVDGIALLPRYLADEHLKTGKFIQVLEAFSLLRTEVTALYPRDRIASLAIKTVIEALVQAKGFLPANIRAALRN